MSEEQGQEQEFEASSGDKKVKIRGSDILTSIIGMIVCSGIVLLLYTQWEHKSDTRDSVAAMLLAVKEQVAIQKEGVQAQREMNCLIAISPNDREKSANFCKQITR